MSRNNGSIEYQMSFNFIDILDTSAQGRRRKIKIKKDDVDRRVELIGTIIDHMRVNGENSFKVWYRGTCHVCRVYESVDWDDLIVEVDVHRVTINDYYMATISIALGRFDCVPDGSIMSFGDKQFSFKVSISGLSTLDW